MIFGHAVGVSLAELRAHLRPELCQPHPRQASRTAKPGQRPGPLPGDAVTSGSQSPAETRGQQMRPKAHELRHSFMRPSGVEDHLPRALITRSVIKIIKQ